MHQELLRTILAHPDDDAPRLVYADWLEENGDADRAEFVRVQCRRYRLGFGSAEYEAHGETLQARERELLSKHKDAWVAKLRLPKNRQTVCWFRRGLVAEVWCTVRYFIEHGDWLLDVTPVETLCLRRTTRRNVTAVVKAPPFSRVRSIRFLMSETPANTVARFAAALPAGHLHELTLSTAVVNTLSAEWYDRNAGLATTLAVCPGLAGLKRLRWRHGGVGDAGGEAIARSEHLAGLEFLDLQENAFSAEVEGRLRERFGRRLCLGRSDYPNFTLGELGWA